MSGERVGDFIIEELFAPGATGAIYLAWHEASRARVALRVLEAPALVDPTRRAQLDHELAVAAGLRHPNLVGIVGQGLCLLTGARYVAYELPQGRSLWDLLEARGGTPLDVADVVPIALGVVDALEALEARGLAHRWLTPHSILVDAAGVVRIVDVGLGALVEPEYATPYTAPEVAAGGPADPRADLYSLGACLFTLLTGQEPPDQGAVVAEPMAAVVHALCAQDGAARYPTARALRRDLERVRGGERPLGPAVPMAAEPPPTRTVRRTAYYDGGGALITRSPAQADPSPTDATRDLDRPLGDLGGADLPPRLRGEGRSYVPRRLLGRGAQGSVYEVGVIGEQRFPGLAQPVKLAALKLFEDEGAATAERAAYALPSPTLVRLLDHGTAEVSRRRRPFLVLERLQPLPCHRVRDARVDLATALDVFVNLLDGLHGLHYRAAGPLLLNGIEPGSIMLRMSTDDAQLPLEEYARRLATSAYEPVLVDMGCASDRELSARGGPPAVARGAPGYWAPEACPGLDRAGACSPKSDVYALTLSLYTLLTGDPPYAATGVHGLAGRELVTEVLALKREGVSPIDLPRLAEVLGPALPEVEEVLALGLHPDPEQRPAARALLQHCRKAFAVTERRGQDGVHLLQGRHPRIHPLYNAYTGRRDPNADDPRPAPVTPPRGHAAPTSKAHAALGKAATGRYGRPVHVVLREEGAALADPSPLRRARAIEAITKAGPAAVVQVAEQLVPALGDPDGVDVRSAAAKALASVDPEQLLEPLLAGLGHASGDVRAEAVRLLGRLRAAPPRVREALTAACDDGVRRVRERALEVLGRLDAGPR